MAKNIFGWSFQHRQRHKHINKMKRFEAIGSSAYRVWTLIATFSQWRLQPQPHLTQRVKLCYRGSTLDCDAIFVSTKITKEKTKKTFEPKITFLFCVFFFSSRHPCEDGVEMRIGSHLTTFVVNLTYRKWMWSTTQQHKQRGDKDWRAASETDRTKLIKCGIANR